MISAGSLQKMLGEESASQTPTLQVLLPISNLSAANNRVKAVLSDSKQWTMAMVTGDAATLFNNGSVKALTLVKVLEYQINFVSSKRVLIVTSLEVVGQESRQQGAPLSFEDGSPVPAENAPSAAGPTSLGPRPSGPVVAAGGGGGGGGGVGGGGGGGGGPQCVPVAHLNPYVNRWTIKVRVTGKSDIKTWNNDRGNGSLFKIDLLDETGGEIGAAFFKEAVGKFYDSIQVGSVYYMSGGRVKMADKRYSGGKDYEINFDDKASITPAHDDRTIKSIHYALTPIRDLEGMEKDKVVDVMGVVKAFDPEAVDFTAKSGKQMTKRELHIMDDSGKGVDVTLWGEMGRALVLSVGSILGIKAGKVSSSDFKTLSLNASWDTKLEVDPMDNPTAATLKAWFDADPEGRMGASVTLSERNSGGGMQGGGSDAVGPLTDLFKRKSLYQCTEDAIKDGHLKQEELYITKAVIDFPRVDASKLPTYPACRTKKDGAMGKTCMKKLVDQGGGSWHCDNHGPAGEEGPEYRYVLGGRMVDATGSASCTLFNDEAVGVLGVSADALHKIKGGRGPSEGDGGAGGGGGDENTDIMDVFHAAHFKEHLISFKMKFEETQGKTYLKTTVVKVRPLVGDVLVRENRAMLAAIKEYMA